MGEIEDQEEEERGVDFYNLLLKGLKAGIEGREEEERGADTNGACNCSRQTSGDCAPTKDLCISGSCTCSSMLGVCVGSCGGSSLLNFIPGFGREEIEGQGQRIMKGK